MSTRSIEPPAETVTAASSASAPVEAASPGDTAAAEAVAAIRTRSSVVPAVAIILGSGLGPAADLVEQDAAFSFADLPGFPAPTVPGHAGRLLLDEVGRRPQTRAEDHRHLRDQVRTAPDELVDLDGQAVARRDRLLHPV